jgi:hypothetical protein
MAQMEREGTMAKDFSDIHSLKPGNLERREIVGEVGRAIVRLSDIESMLAS